MRTFRVTSQLHLEGFTAADYSVLQIPLQHKGRQLVSPRLVEVCRQAGCDGFNTNVPGLMLKHRQLWSR